MVEIWRTCISVIYTALFLLVLFERVDCQCNLPSGLDGTYVHSVKSGETVEDLTFTTTTFTGFTFQPVGQGVLSLTYECKENTGNHYLLRSTTNITHLGDEQYIYVCIYIEVITAGDLYSFYKTTTSGNVAAAAEIATSFGIVSTDASLTIAARCTSDVTSLSTVPYLLVKKSALLTASIDCPNVFLGNFNYTVDGSCAATSDINLCTDTKIAAVDKGRGCGTDISYSTSGSLNCASRIVRSGVTYIYTINPQASVDDSTTFRFLCFALKQNADGVRVDGTLTKSICASGQTEAANGDHVLQFTPHVTCPITTTAAPTTTTDGSAAASSGSGMNIGVIVGAAIGGVVVLVIVGVLIGYFMSKKKAQKVVPDKSEDFSDPGTARSPVK